MSDTNYSHLEGILVISCGSVTPEYVIHQILGVESAPKTFDYNENIKGYPWSFETKYYFAELNLFGLTEKVELDSTFCDRIKAIIFCFDSEKQSSFEDVQSWLSVLKDVVAEVNLLVCNNCSGSSDSTALEKKNILNWCIENGYELIELNPLADSDEEDGSAFKDAKGYDRVIEALQSHTWAKLILKDTTLENSAAIGSDNSKIDDVATCSGNAPEEDKVKTLLVGNEELQLEEKWLDNVLKGEDPGDESFEALFAKFASMKDRASGLTGDDRKKYAEKVAVAFWRAMGGDEDEVEGLDDMN